MAGMEFKYLNFQVPCPSGLLLYFSFQTTKSLDNAEKKIQIEKPMNTSGIGDINNRDKKLPDTIMN